MIQTRDSPAKTFSIPFAKLSLMTKISYKGDCLCKYDKDRLNKIVRYKYRQTHHSTRIESGASSRE